MKIFLAGASGVIGRTLTPLLVKAGHDVVGTTTTAAKRELLLALGARPVVVDVLDRAGVFAALRSEPFDAVIDELTSLHTGDYAANNRLRIDGTRNLVDAARTIGVNRVVAQSYCLYAPGDGLAHEGDPLDLQTGASSGSVRGILELERAVRQMHEPVILRYGTLYGPGTWFAADGPIAARIRGGDFVADNDITSFLHIQDAAHATLLAINGPQGTFNIVDDEPARSADWAPVFAAAIGAPAPRIQTDSAGHQRGVSNSKARHDLRWEPMHPNWRTGFWEVLSGLSATGPATRTA